MFRSLLSGAIGVVVEGSEESLVLDRETETAKTLKGSDRRVFMARCDGGSFFLIM